MNAPLLPALPGYENPQLIAHGATALVFRAIQATLNRPIAIKVITADTGSVPVNAARELATTVALSSQPHIVSIIDTGTTDDGRQYIVMEYCEGGSYAQILRQNGPLPLDDVLEVGIKIGEALHAAHEVGIVHRDVKPSNILRSRFGPALTDFGIARAPDELGSTLARELMTPHHASPEALLHQAQSGPSDVYSLASTLWTLLVGQPPFVDASGPITDIYLFRDRVLNEPLPAMARDDVPAWLVGELTRAMAKLPAQRHATAFEFAEALRRGALGLSTSPGRPARGPEGTGTPPGGTTTGAVPAPGGTTTGAVPARAGTAGASADAYVHTPGLPADAWPALPDTPPVAPAALLTPSSAPAAPPQPPSAGPDCLATAPLPGMRRAPVRLPSTPTASRHRLSAPQLNPPDPEVDEGGWLGPRTSGAWSPGRDAAEDAYGDEDHWPAGPDRTGEAFHSTRRFTDRDVVARGGGRRGALVAVLVGVTVIAVASASLLLLRSRAPEQTAPPVAVGTTTVITAQSPGAPTDVKIAEDRGTSVTLTWTDPTAGTVSFVTVQMGQGDEPPKTQTAQPGSKSVTFTGLSPNRNYCFKVGAVYTVNNVALAPDVCTHR